MKPPAFWNAPEAQPGLMPRVLWPLTKLWQWGAQRRWKRGTFARLSVPVICVGNINVGGTGKTPTVIEIIGLISGLGKKAHVISRGYGGALSGPIQVDPMQHSASDVGDEPLLLAAFAPTWISRDRSAGARAAIAAGAEVLVLDDGMQNPDIIQDFTILVVDAAIGFGNGRLLPAGPLRQEIKNGDAQADVVLAIGPVAAQKRFAQTYASRLTKPIVKARLAPLETGMDWRGLRAFAFAGIGRPAKFYDTLQELGADLVQTRDFGDHQKIPLAVLQRMDKEAQGLNAQLVTTEKDAVRLPDSFRTRVLTLPVRLDIETPEPLVEGLSEVILA